MPILQLPTNPPPRPEPSGDPAGNTPAPPPRVRTGRYGELEEHEILHLIDSLDDERSRARFRESIYISVIVWLIVAWFLIYGPRVLFHQPTYRDTIALLKQHDQEELTRLTVPTPPVLKTPPRIDRNTMQRLQQQEPTPQPPTPQPPTPQPPAQPPQETARNAAPPVQQPPMPLPAAPKPAPSIDAPLPSAPRPNFASNSQSAHSALQDAMRNAVGRSGAEVSAPGASSGPLQAGAQILTDTQGVDFNAYLRRVVSDTKRNWDPLIPEEVQPPLLKRGIVGIRFTILHGGEIGDIKLETTSGDVALDKAAWYAITSEGQFPPLPTAFHGPLIELRFGFYYNTPIQ